MNNLTINSGEFIDSNLAFLFYFGMQPNNHHYFYNIHRTIFDKMSFNRLISYGIKEYVITENISCFFELGSFLMVISQILSPSCCLLLS